MSVVPIVRPAVAPFGRAKPRLRCLPAEATYVLVIGRSQKGGQAIEGVSGRALQGEPPFREQQCVEG